MTHFHPLSHSRYALDDFHTPRSSFPLYSAPLSSSPFPSFLLVHTCRVNLSESTRSPKEENDWDDPGIGWTWLLSCIHEDIRRILNTCVNANDSVVPCKLWKLSVKGAPGEVHLCALDIYSFLSGIDLGSSWEGRCLDFRTQPRRNSSQGGQVLGQVAWNKHKTTQNSPWLHAHSWS